MSKAIPKVRTWRVRFHYSDSSYTDVTVDTINKQFAVWLARDQHAYGRKQHGQMIVYPIKTTATLAKVKP